MSREDAYLVALDALAKLQWNVAMILEAKAAEAEKVRNWLLNHATPDAYPVQLDQLSASIRFHKQNVDLIDSLTKLCNGLNRNMKAILDPEGSDSGVSSMMEGFDLGDSDG
ncbi:hypothetical protein [Cohnella laeviribosi]|uniref:hypothetical protein n=1 Tax=Cohnella laeviribosi TaxID=380174 RepID=UPI000374FE22|nr:hypothetical protein [Cohnella laeviribosi]